HPNITTLYALQLEGQDAFMVMELVRGYTLNDLLAKVRRLSLRESLAVVAQAVAGLGYAHRRGVIHRDIKPSNLMVTDEGVLKIMDFGIARVRGSQQMTRTGDFQGTLAYASPEQIRGEHVDERSDIYSLAIVLYKMLAGVVPFDGVGDYALMTAHLQTPPPPLRGRVPELDVPIEAALMQALAKRPDDRYASVAEFGRAVGPAPLRTVAGGGVLAALGVAGWFFLLPPNGDRTAQPSLAQEQPQPTAAGKAGGTVAVNEPSKPIIEQSAPVQPQPSVPAAAEKPAPAAEE